MPPKGAGDYLIAVIRTAIKNGQLFVDNEESLMKYYQENKDNLLGKTFSEFKEWALYASSHMIED